MTTPTDATLDAVLAVLARGPDGALTLAPGGARTIQTTLAAITDPERFQRALADVLGLAGYLGAVRGAP
ncbi:hypothetical protein L6R52_22000, partial [Myxococcota bacterium]|nr:hypothetical protein [Myxococcota bacterium]